MESSILRSTWNTKEYVDYEYISKKAYTIGCHRNTGKLLVASVVSSILLYPVPVWEYKLSVVLEPGVFSAFWIVSDDAC